MNDQRAAMSHPQDESIIDPGTNAMYLLEINAGLAAKWGLQMGDKFTLNTDGGT